jgi:amidohydrolase
MKCELSFGQGITIPQGTLTKSKSYAMHNWPGLRTGIIDVQPGPRMASCDNFDIHLEGTGGHAAMPHLCHDPIVASAQVITALQTLVSRHANPVDPLVVSVTRMHGGSEAYNVIPRTVSLGGTMRTFSRELRAEIPKKMDDLVKRIASGFDCQGRVVWLDHGFPPTINHEEQSRTAHRAAIKTAGRELVTQNCKASMGAEDFSHMLEKKRGAYVFVGAGEKTAPLHNPLFDFNDDILSTGAELFVNMAMESLGQEFSSKTAS